MGISFAAATQQFHLYNDRISYVMKVLRDGHLGQLYFGARLPEDRDYGHFVHTDYYRPTTAYVFDNEYGFSREHLRQEYPSYGTTDFREGAVELAQPHHGLLLRLARDRRGQAEAAGPAGHLCGGGR